MITYVHHVDSNPTWDRPRDGSATWALYWKKHSKVRMPFLCPDCGRILNDDNVVGAHVKKNYFNNSIYIVPVCKSCNSKHDNHSFSCDDSLLVPANIDRIN